VQDPADEKVRVAVVGAGAFGRNHLRVYRELEQAGYPVKLAALIDPNLAARAAAEALYEVPAFAEVADWLASETHGSQLAASVCVPTVQHAVCAQQLMAAGVDVLIEKPIAATLADADAIVATAKQYGRVAQVGHLERFNPAVGAVRGLLNHPMFFEVHRMSVFTPRSLDVDVVLDLMIHDLDIVLNLVGQPVREVRAVGLPVLSNKVDIANVRLEFENGCVANFTASRVSTERVRKMRFFQPHQYLSLDFARQDLLLIDVTAAAGLARLLHPTHDGKAVMNGAPEDLRRAKENAGILRSAQDDNVDAQDDKIKTPETLAAAGEHPSGGMEIRKVAVEAGEPLRLEIVAFLDAVRARVQPLVTLEDGRAALSLALEITAAIASHAQRTGL
jgi:predicted dehydrogenase